MGLTKIFEAAIVESIEPDYIPEVEDQLEEILGILTEAGIPEPSIEEILQETQIRDGSVGAIRAILSTAQYSPFFSDPGIHRRLSRILEKSPVRELSLKQLREYYQLAPQPIEAEDPLEILLEELQIRYPLPTGIFNTLKRSGFQTVADLLSVHANHPQGLESVSKISSLGVSEIQAQLLEVGVDLADYAFSWERLVHRGGNVWESDNRCLVNVPERGLNSIRRYTGAKTIGEMVTYHREKLSSGGLQSISDVGEETMAQLRNSLFELGIDLDGES